MKTTKNKLPSGTRAKSVDILQSRLSESIDMYAKLKQAHWNVKGKQFLSLHEIFGEVAGQVEAQSDDIAERIVQLGGIANGLLAKVVKNSALPEISSTETSQDKLVEAIADRLAQYGAGLLSDFVEVEKLGDHGTGNMLIGFCQEIDKSLWKVESYLM